MSTATATEAWLSTTEAARRLGLTADQFRRLLRQGGLTVKALPGLRKMILERDVDRLAAESVVPAK